MPDPKMDNGNMPNNLDPATVPVAEPFSDDDIPF